MALSFHIGRQGVSDTLSNMIHAALVCRGLIPAVNKNDADVLVFMVLKHKDMQVVPHADYCAVIILVAEGLSTKHWNDPERDVYACPADDYRTIEMFGAFLDKRLHFLAD